MYGHGHEHGTKTVSRKSQRWYDVHAETRLAEMEAQAEVARLAHVVGDAVTALPEAAPRIAKAATLVQAKQVWPLTSGSFLVGAQRDTETAYLVRRGPWTCECADHTSRAVTCTHVLAVQITVKMGTTYRPNYALTLDAA